MQLRRLLVIADLRVVSMDVEFLKTIDLFSNLDALHLAHLSSIAGRSEHKAGTVLFEDGDSGSEIYVVGEGKVRISKMVPGIGEEALAVLSSGAYFGEMEYIDRDLNRAARATIHERAVLYTFGYQELDDLMGSDRDLALAITSSMLRTFSRRLRSTNDKLTAMFAMAQFG